MDDEPMIAFTLRKIFELAGYQAQAFTNPMDALKTGLELQPDLLIAEVVMPNMSGIHLAIAFTKLFPACKVLLVSALATTADLAEGANGHGLRFPLLPKPIHPDNLLHIVEELLESPAGTAT